MQYRLRAQIQIYDTSTRTSTRPTRTAETVTQSQNVHCGRGAIQSVEQASTSATPRGSGAAGHARGNGPVAKRVHAARARLDAPRSVGYSIPSSGRRRRREAASRSGKVREVNFADGAGLLLEKPRQQQAAQATARRREACDHPILMRKDKREDIFAKLDDLQTQQRESGVGGGWVGGEGDDGASAPLGSGRGRRVRAAHVR